MISASGPKQQLNDLYSHLIDAIPPDSRIRQVQVGLHWTCVALEISGRLQCGLASTVVGQHPHGEANNVGQAGQLLDLTARQLANLIHQPSPTERALGLATINASLSKPDPSWTQANALEVLQNKGADRTVGMVGHFPFIPKLKPVTARLFVLEKDPGPGEFPATAAAEILPDCEVIAITSMTLLNGSFAELLPLIPPESFVMLLGPSTPLSPRMFELGVDMLAGTYVEKIDPVVTAIQQGANYRQIHSVGTTLVTMEASA